MLVGVEFLLCEDKPGKSLLGIFIFIFSCDPDWLEDKIDRG